MTLTESVLNFDETYFPSTDIIYWYIVEYLQISVAKSSLDNTNFRGSWCKKLNELDTNNVFW